MYHSKRDQAYLVHINAHLKRSTALVAHVRYTEVPMLYRLLTAWIDTSRPHLLKHVRSRAIAKEHLFFHTSTGKPFDTAARMAHKVSSIVAMAAGELGLYATQTGRIRCTPHTIRHAMYEYINTANVPAPVRESIAKACLHTVDVANRFYGKLSHDRKTALARQYVYKMATELLDINRESTPRIQPVAAVDMSAENVEQAAPHTTYGAHALVIKSFYVMYSPFKK